MQRERFEQAKTALKTFEAKHGNKYLFSDTKDARAWNNKRAVLQEAVAEAYWTTDMEIAVSEVAESVCKCGHTLKNHWLVSPFGWTHCGIAGCTCEISDLALIAMTSGCPECGKSDSHEEGCQIGATEQFEDEQREIRIRDSRVSHFRPSKSHKFEAGIGVMGAVNECIYCRKTEEEHL